MVHAGFATRDALERREHLAQPVFGQAVLLLDPADEPHRAVDDEERNTEREQEQHHDSHRFTSA